MKLGDRVRVTPTSGSFKGFIVEAVVSGMMKSGNTAYVQVNLPDGSTLQIPASLVTVCKDEIQDVSVFIRHLLAQKWLVEKGKRNSDSVALYKSYCVEHTGVFTFRVVIDMVQGDVNGTGKFVSCRLYAPVPMAASSGLMREYKPAKEWKTFTGAINGFQVAYTRLFESLKSKYPNLILVQNNQK